LHFFLFRLLFFVVKLKYTNSWVYRSFGVEISDRVAWAFGPCITIWPYLRPVLTIDAGFLSDRYVGKLFMTCDYDAEQQLLPLAFDVVAGEESVANWG
jgi:hypothetical protein